MKVHSVAFALAVISAFVTQAVADWNPEDMTKWVQLPDLNTTGVDVNASLNQSYDFILADDFKCTLPDTIVSIHIWASWLNDVLPLGKPDSVKFVLGIHTDIPDSMNPNGYSMPGDLIWSRTFLPGEFTARPWAGGVIEGWMDPPFQYWSPADTTCWQYNFPLPTDAQFVQSGTHENPVVYWLAVKAAPYDGATTFGWKTSLNHWNDGAVWGIGDEPFSGLWSELIYPPSHGMSGESIDLAFAVVGKNAHMDWGDAPDSPTAPGYPTLGIHDGARHIMGGPYFGTPPDDAPDGEADGQPSAMALGDDNDGNDDEDSAEVIAIAIGFAAALDIWVSGDTAYVEGWVDFNQDQIWQHPEEQIMSFRWYGHLRHPVPVPDSIVPGYTYARFRVSTSGGLTPYGLAMDGEVEDQMVLAMPYTFSGVKWSQYPYVSRYGIDVNCTEPYIAADDFACTETELIREINIWGGWYGDNKPYDSPDSARFTISFHADIPESESQTGYSMPGELLWVRTFEPGEFNASVYRDSLAEGWLMPPDAYLFPGDSTCWRYTFMVPEAEAFMQQGSDEDTIVYWLDVQALPFDADAFFGWKTSHTHWNDAAVCGMGSEPHPGPWDELLYPPGHRDEGEAMDMAFCLHRESVSAVSDRATQPAGFMLYQNMPNPFSPITVIQYDVPHEGAEVSIRVYDVKGRHISTIADGKQSLGRQMASWDGRDEKGQDIASGIYFYRMKAPGFEMTRKVVILR